MSTEKAEVRPLARVSTLTALFVVTIFLSASLLFFVQPLFTKIVLPHIGGSPAVWATAMLFFQVVLIAGYLYAHISARYLTPPVQLGLHLVLWACALIFLPLAIPDGFQYDAQGPIAWQTLVLYAAGVGLPFAVLSANAPLLQSWYGRTDGPSSDDPYFLYAASNLGSFIALLGFPLVAEPLFGARAIGMTWAAGFVTLGIFLFATGAMTVRSAREQRQEDKAADQMAFGSVRLQDMAIWAFLAFIPSSLMLGISTKLGVDLGAVPLIWVLPLGLYLLSFVFGFSDRPVFQAAWMSSVFTVSILTLCVLVTYKAFQFTESRFMDWAAVIIILLMFFIISLIVHNRLYQKRPGRSSLTVFYVIISIGGALGGAFNSLVAPWAFNDLYELPITLALTALLLLPRSGNGAIPKKIIIGLGVIVIASGLTALYGTALIATGLPPMFLILAIVVVITAIWSHNDGLAPSIITFGCVAVLVLMQQQDAVYRDRSFFGTHRVVETGGIRVYANGTTVHGGQWLDEAKRLEPLQYHHPRGPLGELLTSEFASKSRTIGIVGLGIGALSCYRKPDQDWHFYEIDQKVDDIARDPSLFTFMSSCAADQPTHMGDARIVLENQVDMKFDILVMEAYSSDAIPIHLTTLEAVKLYFNRLKSDGILVFHISNRFYNIDIPLARIARELGLEARIRLRSRATETLEKGELPSVVVVMAREPGALDWLNADPRWKPLKDDGGVVWTDDFANPLSILK